MKEDANRDAGEAVIRRWVEALQGESARGTLLLATSVLDVELDGLLRAAALAGTKEGGAAMGELLKGPQAPLRSLWAKTRAALALGLLSPEEAKFIDALRNARNNLAHRVEAFVLTEELLRRLVPAGLRAQVRAPTYDPKLLPDTEDYRRVVLTGAVARHVGHLRAARARLEAGVRD